MSDSENEFQDPAPQPSNADCHFGKVARNMATNDQSLESSKEDEPLLPALEIGSDDADKRLEHGGNVTQQLHRWMKCSIFSEPKPLIYTDGSGHLAIWYDTLMEICEITWNLVIVGIAGPYRCGKSFLMNRLVGKSKGFFVGKTTDAATKGIWVRCIKHPEQEETVLLLLDTEGLGDIRKGNKNHDNKILTLITLLSNVLVFNMRGPFDEDSMSKLSFTTQISKNVKFGSGPKKEKNLPIVMPELILCLRDFFLEFEDGIDSPDMYFEDCLKEYAGEVEYNAPRQSVKNFFQIRHCFTFPFPADGNTMKCLENADEKELSESFLERAKQFNQHIFNCKQKQMIDSEFSVSANIHGPIFKGLLEYYVDCTRKGAIPDIENAFFTASSKENEIIMQEVKDEFKTMMNSIRLPVDSIKDVQGNVHTHKMKCLETFRERMKLDKNNKQEKQLQSDLEKVWDEMKTKNSQLLQEKFVEKLSETYRGTIEVTIPAFLKENGYQEYKIKLMQMKMDCEKKYDQSLKSEFNLAWSVFKNTIRHDEIHVLETDSKVTKEEKKRQKREMDEEKAKAKKEYENMRKQLDDEVKRLNNKSRLQEQREEMNKKQLDDIKRELLKFKRLGVWQRVKFLFKGTLDD